jgi:hypothetical protein
MPSPPSPNLSQFNLRTMFVGVAMLAAVFAAASYGGWPGLVAAATLAALVAAHVVGNAIGTRLRDEVSPQWNPRPDVPRWDGRRGFREREVTRGVPAEGTGGTRGAPATNADGTPSVPATAEERRLHQRTPLGRIIHLTSAGAALVGALMGGAALAFWTSTSFSGWVVGTLSSAVVGGFVGFLLACFLEMTIRAWWQASKSETEVKEDMGIPREIGG